MLKRTSHWTTLSTSARRLCAISPATVEAQTANIITPSSADVNTNITGSTPHKSAFAPPQNIPWSTAKDMLKSIPPVHYSQLSNGFKVATEHIPGLDFVTIGIWIDAGSRFETRENNGVAHFLEHMNFKGTENYSKAQIEEVFESLGAHFNAYTSRDRTAYYIKVFIKDVPRVIDLLADILKNGLYKESYIEYERPTILSEMREVEEIVDEVIMDNLHMTAYDSSHCGLPLTILGPTDNIAKHINRRMIVDYINTHYTGPRMTMVSCGGMAPDEVHQLAQKHFGDLPSHSNRPVLNAKYVGGTATLWNEKMLTATAHIAFPVCGAANRDVVPLQLFHYFYGSYRREMMQQFIFQGSNSDRKFIPELDRVQFFYTPYEDTGLMGCQLTSVPSQGENDDALAITTDHFLHTIRRLIENPPSYEDLEAAKCAYKASQMLALDSTTNSAEDLGRQMVHFGRRIPLQEHFESVDSITPIQFSDTLSKYFEHKRPTISAAGPPAALPQFDSMLDVLSKTKSL